MDEFTPDAPTTSDPVTAKIAPNRQNFEIIDFLTTALIKSAPPRLAVSKDTSMACIINGSSDLIAGAWYR
jgi:hypothetical protein